ncbi:MAG: hypothetical protein NZM35_01615 [Chitinophagales bacterium]|nr:hypothetical protein [Chitinophagales bacterium]MDW8418201.1 hypothetical protein [Chitinophagales bacterium]
MNITTKNDKIVALTQSGYSLTSTEYIKEGFQIFKKDIGGFVGFTLLYIVISVVLGLIPFIGSLISFVISPALSFGFAIVSRKIYFGEAHSFSDFFGGFKRLGDLFFVNFLMLIMILIGFLLLIIPGIYLSIAYVFAPYITYFYHEGSFWNNLERSRKLISKEWFSFFIFAILLLLLNIAGLLLLGIGMLVTLPVSAIAVYVAFEKIVGTEEEKMFDFEKTEAAAQ